VEEGWRTNGGFLAGEVPARAGRPKKKKINQKKINQKKKSKKRKPSGRPCAALWLSDG
jgi:hypothetical protein